MAAQSNTSSIQTPPDSSANSPQDQSSSVVPFAKPDGSDTSAADTSQLNNHSSPSSAYSIAAEYAAEHGWPVFPLTANEKRPATSNGFKNASRDLNQLRQWFHPNSTHNIGVVTGPKSGLVIIDLDEKNGVSGSASLASAEAKHGELPVTLRSTTGSGGQHLFFRYPAGVRVRNRAAVLPGVDVRGDGGYVVAPGSLVSGSSYRWQDKDAAIAELPQWLLKLITGKGSASESAPAEGASIPNGSRNDALFRFAMGQMRSGHHRDKVEKLVLDANTILCAPPMEEQEVRQIVENVYRLYKDRAVSNLTDIGNGRKMAELYGTTVRFVLETKDRWLQWNGTYWSRVPQTVISGLSKAVPEAYAKEADGLPDGPEKTTLKKHALRSSSKLKLDAAVELFKSEPNIGISMSDLDTHDFLFPAQNGVIDLKTAAFLKSDPAMLITQVGGTSYDANATCPRWEKFLIQVMNNDAEMVTYLQRVVGYALSGSTAEQCMFFGYGFGANGKSTFLNIVRTLLGDLGMQASSETLMETKRSSSGTSSDIARLRGKRFVAMSETDDGRHLNEGMVKSLTGGDRIIARDLYQSIFEFKPSHKFFLASNHKPTIKGTDHGIWRRIRLIPFSVTIPEKDRNSNLEAELCEELPGILNWAIKGCIDWQQHGLSKPKAIEQATSEYKADMDIVGSWISERCVLSPSHELSFDQAYKSFDPWCKENYNFSFSKKRLGQMLIERGFEAVNRGGRKYRGIALNSSVAARLALVRDEEKDEEF